MYSYIKDNQKVGKTAKGIKKNIIKSNIKHEDYKNVLINNKQIHHTMKTIRSINHQLGSYELNKVSLSCFDDKRFIANDGINSSAYGHYTIQKCTTTADIFIRKIIYGYVFDWLIEIVRQPDESFPRESP